MKLLLHTIIITGLLSSCGSSRSRTIPIWIENSSNANRVIQIATFVDDSLYDIRSVYRDSIADRILPFNAILKSPKNKSGWTFKFKNEDTKEETACIVPEDSISNISFLHVNYVEMIYKKGFDVNGIILMKDSVVKRSFKCQPVYRLSN
jgi:hypothetical protein